MMTSCAKFMWRSMEVLHRKNSPIVPCSLMLVAGSLIVYRHMNTPRHINPQSDGIKTFLGLILMQMLPLAALEFKITSCADPVGMFCKLAAPVTLMHAIFLVMRVCQYPLHEQGYITCSVLGLAGAVVTLHKGFRQGWYDIFQYTAVWKLVALAFAASALTESVIIADAFLRGSNGHAPTLNYGKLLAEVVMNTSTYVELLAFVPAVWMMYREDAPGEHVTHVSSIDTKRTSTAFFVFLVLFYISEDMFDVWLQMSRLPLLSIAHLVHFLLLLDFACFVLAHVYNPEKLMGELRKWLPADLAYEV